MNASSKNLDFLTKHWAPFRRQYPALFPLISSDILPAKAHDVRAKFSTCNFSMILGGEGWFEREGRLWPVRSPCVITQWPGELVAYGPSERTWTEWYLIYDRSQFKRFAERGLIDRSRPVWPIADPASLRLRLAEFSVLARSPDPARVVDRVDRIAEQAILDSWLFPAARPDEDADIRAVAAQLQESPATPWDFATLAAGRGFSTTTFRRRWVDALGTPPGQYLQHLRMAEACRLLVETSQPIQAVAAATGFDDAFYFSRRFRMEIGQSPGSYRKTYTLRR